MGLLDKIINDVDFRCSIIIVGAKTEEVFEDQECLEVFLESSNNEELKLRVFGKEYIGDFENTYIGWVVEMPNDKYGYVIDENFFKEYEDKINLLKKKFYKHLNKKPKIIVTFLN